MAKKPTAIRLRGCYSAEDVEVLKQRCRLPVYQEHLLGVGLESEQQEVKDALDDAMDVFMVNPAQSGFAAVSELTAQAIASPETTVAVMSTGDDASATVRADMGTLRGQIAETGAAVFDNIEDASDHVQSLKMVDDTGDHELRD
jgi:hypothetical protein